MADATTEAAGAYAGLRVLDFTSGVAGPMACGLLAQFDADVLKVEGPAGDRMREHPGYIAWNCNKRRVVLDLATPAGLARAKELIADADVAVFDWALGEMERLGLDATALTAAHPRLIHAWLPMYGTTGRWADLPPEDSLLAATSGVSFSQFSWEDVPVQLITPQVSYGHATLAAGAIGTALFERERSGKGQGVVCSGVHAAGAVRSGGAIRAPGMQRMGAGRGARGGSPNYRLYQCGDGEWLFMATLTLPFFLRGLEALDLLELLAMDGVEGEIANLQKPPTNEEVIARIDARFAEKTRAEWMEIFGQMGVPAGPVGHRDEWFVGEQVAANEMRIELDHPVHGRVALPGVSAKLTASPGRVRAVMTDGQTADGWLPRRPPEPPAAALPPAAKPLAGVRILDMGNVIAGPFGPTVLSNYGADVIKVEPPEGDTFRIAAIGFAGWNRGKRSVVIDLKTEEGCEAFKALVRTSDVVVDNFRRGVTERLGIDYESLRKVNPNIITVSVMGFGPTGPLAGEPGFDPVLQARGGLMAAQGGDDEPVFHTVAVNDEASGLMSAFATVTALYARARTGRGQHVWTSLANQSVVTQSGELTTWPGRPPMPLGDRDCPGVSALHRLYACEDGWIALAATTAEHANALGEALGRPSWFDAATALTEPRDGALAARIAESLATLGREAAVELLLKHGVPAAPAIRVEETHEDPWLVANGFWEEYELPGHGPVLGLRGYAEFSRTPGGFTLPAPQLGAHTEEVLRSLGMG